LRFYSAHTAPDIVDCLTRRTIYARHLKNKLCHDKPHQWHNNGIAKIYMARSAQLSQSKKRDYDGKSNLSEKIISSNGAALRTARCFRFTG